MNEIRAAVLTASGLSDKAKTHLAEQDKNEAINNLVEKFLKPAGADEHWKTANSALNRIRDAFSRRTLSPYTFFVGAAIENSMAKEIWAQLANGVLTNAANLNKVDQMASLSNWIVSL